MHTAGVPEFSLVNALQVDKETFRRNLSALVNMAKFRCRKLQIYQELNQEVVRSSATP